MRYGLINANTGEWADKFFDTWSDASEYSQNFSDDWRVECL